MRFLASYHSLAAAVRGAAFAACDVCRHAWRTYLIWAKWRDRPTIGESGERAAASYLGRLGYHIVGRGVNERLGELDIVAIDGRTMVYVEVKTRRSELLERPGAAVDRAKRNRICLAANAYARKHHVHDCASRFDIVEVVWPAACKRPIIRHWPAAFESELS